MFQSPSSPDARLPAAPQIALPALEVFPADVLVRATATEIRAKFTQPSNVTLRQIIETANEESKRLYKRVAVFLGHLEGVEGLDAISEHEKTHEFSILMNTRYKSRTDQVEILKKDGMQPAPASSVIVAAAIFRVVHGFPKYGPHIGQKEDPGCLFNGVVVRAAECSIVSYDIGLDLYFDHNLGGRPNFIMAGSPHQSPT